MGTFATTVEHGGWPGLLAIFTGLLSLVLGLVLVVVRSRGRTGRALTTMMLAASLAPFAFGTIGLVLERAHVDEVLGMLGPAVTPRDREQGERQARAPLLLAAWFGTPGFVLLPLVWLRHRDRPDPAGPRS